MAEETRLRRCTLAELKSLTGLPWVTLIQAVLNGKLGDCKELEAQRNEAGGWNVSEENLEKFLEWSRAQMNRVMLLGRLTATPELKQSTGSNSMSVLRFSLAVDRRKKGEVDFISCVAFGKTAEFIANYFGKGVRIAVSGRIQTGSYTKQDGSKIYTTDVIVDECDFCEKSSTGTSAAPADSGEWHDLSDDGLPFM